MFLGWTGLYPLFVLGIAVLARDTLATSFRYRGAERPATSPARPRATPTVPATTSTDPLSLVGPRREAFAFYWAVLAGIGVVTWVILYLL